MSDVNYARIMLNHIFYVPYLRIFCEYIGYLFLYFVIFFIATCDGNMFYLTCVGMKFVPVLIVFVYFFFFYVNGGKKW